MLKIKSAGIAIVETILVLAISSGMFLVVISAFNARQRTEANDSARQVMSEIAKVRNQAQKGQGPETDAVVSNLANQDLFGQAIEFVQPVVSAPTSESKMVVYKLAQNRLTKEIGIYGQYDIAMPSGLGWYINTSSSPTCNEFTSCYIKNPPTTPSVYKTLNNPIVGTGNAGNIMLVIRNNSGQSYAFNKLAGADLGSAKSPDNYTADRQVVLRLAFARPDTGSTLAAQMASAKNQFYAVFDLSIPNNQSLEVKK
jgi:type II secretory pathway pseudopilin PulG